MHTPLPLQTRPEPGQHPHPPMAGPQGPPDAEHEHPAPASSRPGGCAFQAHRAIWLWVVGSWYGIQNATPDGSVAPVPSQRIGAIQSCGCWQSALSTFVCTLPGHS